jgi:GPH family glycoside/pentoside/hexuronide:cation symporter
MDTKTTQSSEKLTRRSMCAYGIGLVSHQFGHVGLGMLAMPIFNVEMGLSPALVGGLLMVARCLDAFTDPVMGAISDNTRTRWGRRRPYLALGALLSAFLYPMIWLGSSQWSPMVLAIYFCTTSILFYLAHTVFSVPYLSLGYELTNNYDERTRLQAWRSYFNTAVMLLIGWFYYFCQMPVFGGPVQGARVLGFLVGVGILVFGLVPAIFLREINYSFVQHQEKERFFLVAKQAFSNKPFLILLGIIVTLIIGTQTAGALGFYLNVYHLYGGDKLAAGALIGVGTLVGAGASFASAPMIAAYAKRTDKTTALQACLIMSIIGAISSWFLYTPMMPYLSLVPLVFLSLGGNAFWILVNSMKADVCDWDEMTSGRRREGIYGALGNWMQKSATSVTYFAAGLVLQFTGFNAAVQGAQTPEAINGMRLGFALIPVVFLLPCLWLLKFYPITKAKALEIQEQLRISRDRQSEASAATQTGG